jgi:hypothetical protein
MINEPGAVGSMRIGRGNWSMQRNPTAVLLGSPQIQHYLTWDETSVGWVGSQQLTTWALACPEENLKWRKFNSEIIAFRLVKLNIKWGKSINQGTSSGGSHCIC